MKAYLIAAVSVLGGLTSAVSHAQEGPEPPGPGPHGPGEGGGRHRNGPPSFQGPGPRWMAADSNKDGSLSAEEFATIPRLQALSEEKRQSLFKRFDKNRDGVIGRDELAQAGKPRNGRPGPKLWELDHDHSGGISLDEFKTDPLVQKLPADRQEQLFLRLDSNRDGMITPKDNPPRPMHPPRDQLDPPHSGGGQAPLGPPPHGGAQGQRRCQPPGVEQGRPPAPPPPPGEGQGDPDGPP